MIAEFQAADITTTTANSASTKTASSSSSAAGSASGSSFYALAVEIKVTEEAIVTACQKGNLSELRQWPWGRQGIRVASAVPLCHAAYLGKFDMIRCLVKDLGADVSQAGEDGSTAFLIAVPGPATSTWCGA
jgi:hypothetical protein